VKTSQRQLGINLATPIGYPKPFSGRYNAPVFRFLVCATAVLGLSLVTTAQDPNVEVSSAKPAEVTKKDDPTHIVAPLKLRATSAVGSSNLQSRLCFTFTLGEYEKLQKTALKPNATFIPTRAVLVPFKSGPESLYEALSKFSSTSSDFVLESNAGGVSGQYALYPSIEMERTMKPGTSWLLALANEDRSMILLQGSDEYLDPYTIPQLSQPLGFSPQQVEGIKVDDPTVASGERTERGWRSAFNIGSNLPASARSNRSFVVDGLISQFNGDRQSFVRANYRVEVPIAPVKRTGILMGTESAQSPVLLAKDQFVPKFFYQVSHLSNQALTQNQLMGEAGISVQPLKLGGPLEPLTLTSSLQLPYFHKGFRKLDTLAAGSQRLALALSTGARLKVGAADARFQIASRRWFMFRDPGAGFYKNPSQLEFSLMVPTQFGSLPSGAARQYIQISYFSGQTEQRQFGPNSNVAGSFGINIVSF
jgi:hypothetical protein